MTYKLAIIAGEFHKDLVEQMVKYACQEASNNDAEITEIYRVLGSLEVPLIMQEIIEHKNIDGIILLGIIEKGATLHGEVIAHQVFNKVLFLQLKYKIPVGLGIIGPVATLEQAKARLKESAKKAVSAVVKVLEIKKGLTV
jgi:6,7-dimethyl-8-ribityllumazine synthase